MSNALRADLRRKVAVTLACMEDKDRQPDTLFECELRFGRCTQNGFDACIEPHLFYGAFEMTAFGDVYAPGRVSAWQRRRVEKLPHDDPACRYRVRHVPSDVRKCRAEIKRVVHGAPVRQFATVSPDAHDVRISLARELRIREHECVGKQCAVPHKTSWHERRTLRFDAHRYWKVDFTRVCDPGGVWRYHIEIELRVRSLLRHAGGEEIDIGAVVESGIEVMHRVQSGLRNATTRHSRTTGNCQIRGRYCQ